VFLIILIGKASYFIKSGKSSFYISFLFLSIQIFMKSLYFLLIFNLLMFSLLENRVKEIKRLLFF
jgi:hypothetical protein